MNLSRRYLLRFGTCGGLLATLSACSSSTAPSAAGAATGTPSRPATATPAPTWRGGANIPLTPDSVPRNVKTTKPQGEPLSVDGITITIPAGCTVGEVEGLTQAVFPDAVDGLPRVRIEHLKDLGHTLEKETYFQEVLLSGELDRTTKVRRTKETWPKAKDAYVLTWDTTLTDTSGSHTDLSIVAFYLDDGQGGAWIQYATALKDQLTEGSPLWDTVFSAVID